MGEDSEHELFEPHDDRLFSEEEVDVDVDVDGVGSGFVIRINMLNT
jgi:hypothetical protein